MKVNELRVGNWFMGYHDPFKWILEHFDLLKQADLDEIIKEPIPLSEDILLKCGFEMELSISTPTFICKQRRDLIVQSLPEIGSYIFRIKAGMGYPTFVRYVDYLHQLQNLFFAITGEELEVEL